MNDAEQETLPRSILKQSSSANSNSTSPTKKSVTITTTNTGSEGEVVSRSLREGVVSLEQTMDQLKVSEPMAEIGAACLTALNESEAHRQRVKAKFNRAAERKAKHKHRHHRHQRQETQPSRSAKLPECPELSDGKEVKWDYWWFMVKLNLEGNADDFPKPMHRIGYVVSRCKGKALDHVIPRIREGCLNPYKDYEDVIEHLKEIFEDPNRMVKALAEYYQLKMASGDDFGDFLIEFHRVAQEAEIPKKDWKSGLFEKLDWSLLDGYLQNTIATEVQNDIDFVEFSRICRDVFTVNSFFPKREAPDDING